MNAKNRRLVLPSLSVVLLVLWVLFEAAVAARERARRRVCRATVGNCLIYACVLYSGDNDERFPPSLGYLFKDYMSDGRLYLCPSAGKATEMTMDKYTPGMSFDRHTDFVYVSGLRADDPPDYVLIFEDEWNHDGDGVQVVFISGHRPWWDLKTLHRQLDKQEKELAAKGREMRLLRPQWSSWPDPSASEHPLAGPQAWYYRRGGRAAIVGAVAAAMVTLWLVMRGVKRRRDEA